MSMNNVNVTLDTIGALSRMSSTNMDMKESVFNFIKKDILSDEINNLIYLTIPMWSYSKGTWNKDIPTYYANECYYELYKQFFACLNELEFSFVDFVSTKLKTIPLYVDIEYVDGPLSEYCNSVDSDRIHIFFSKDSIINYRVEDILSIRESDADFKKFAAQLLSHIVNYDVNVALKLYKFLGVYTIYFADLKYITIINSILYKPTNTSKDVGYGGAIVVLKKELSEMAKSLISIVLNIKHKEIAVSDWIEKNTIDLQRESLKSAVSAIMTRNMSHNLGSHYLHYTKTQLEQLAKKGGEFGPDIRGAARVMGYMQGRMDYLATLISMDRYPYGCVNFKSQIFDELTIDDFSKRHFQSKGINLDDELCNKIETLCKEVKELQSIQDKLKQEAQNNYKNIDRKIIERILVEFHTVSGEALKDESHNRTTNFLLSNLILSENFTRSSILDDNLEVTNNSNKISLQVLLFENDKGEIFTGTLDKKNSEKDIKRKLSEINIAMPGGVMSCHAFFNIVENFIRNSAKYLQSYFNEDEGLIITIRIEDIDGEYNFTIYDNKRNANAKVLYRDPATKDEVEITLQDSIKNRLKSLRILDENNAIEKSNKGFKEMLFSAIWLRSYIFQNTHDNDIPNCYSDVLSMIQSTPDGDVKLELIEKYGFAIVGVDDQGNIPISDDNGLNLGLRFALPKYKRQIELQLSEKDNAKDINSVLNIYGDIANVSEEKLNNFSLRINNIIRNRGHIDSMLIVPRLTQNAHETDVAALEEVLKNRFTDFDKYSISIGDLEEKEFACNENMLYFERHLSSKREISDFKDYAYADSISGGNFTSTLSERFEQWIKTKRDKKSPEYYEVLKMKESALTRITLIDERLYDEMVKQNLETELACKNIRVLKYTEPQTSKCNDVIDLFIGNNFNRGANETHFLSIHLGIIEKIIQDSKAFNCLNNKNNRQNSDDSIDNRAIAFMDMLKQTFGPKVFISIHSGRGNFSKELNGPLAIYPFISMAALENTYNNSKYLLCQLFYSTIYIGKGVANIEDVLK